MMQGDNERRRLLRENNVQLERLREEGISLSTKVSGGTIAKVSSALSSADLSGKYFADKERSILDQLKVFGVSIRDLTAVAEEFGIQNVAENGRIVDIGAVRQLIAALSISGPARIGQSFSDQLRFFRETQSMTGATGATAGSALIQFLRGSAGRVSAFNSIDLSNPANVANQLFALRTSLNNGGVSQALLGNLTGEQFSQILGELFEMFSAQTNAPTNAPVAPSGSTSTGGGGMPSSSGGAPTIPQESVQVVIKMMDANLSNILTTHTDLHNRIAKATEGSHERLVSIDGKMSQLIVATADGAATINVRLEALRLVAAANAGRGPSFG
jgi:hypothetical protein